MEENKVENKIVKLDMPKKYEYIEGESNPLYKDFHGRNKISYSQYTSFNEDYTGQYIANYILGYKEEGGIFAYFGSACGDYVNKDDQRVDEFLSMEDKLILDAIPTPKGSVFEYEIVIDLLPLFGIDVVVQGFSDRQHMSGKQLEVCDFKTLNLAKKKSFYQSDKYQQLNVYSFGLEQQGYNIGDVYVIGLGRKGNTMDQSSKNVLRLSGEVERIDHPYSKDEALQTLESMANTAIEISRLNKLIKRLNK